MSKKTLQKFSKKLTATVMACSPGFGASSLALEFGKPKLNFLEKVLQPNQESRNIQGEL